MIKIIIAVFFGLLYGATGMLLVVQYILQKDIKEGKIIVTKKYWNN